MKKSIKTLLLTTTFALTFSITALAAGSTSIYGGCTWENTGGTSWKLKQSDNSYVSNAWYQDTDGAWYYLKSDGYMAEQVFTDTDGSVYLLDWRHDGQYGKLLTSGTYNGVTIQTNEAHDGTWGRILNTEVIESLKAAIGADGQVTNTSNMSREEMIRYYSNLRNQQNSSVSDGSDVKDMTNLGGGTSGDEGLPEIH